MERIWQKIISSKENPISWPILLILAIISLFYRGGQWLADFINSKRVNLDTPVISIGNLTVGGTGKTPVTILIARHSVEKGKKVGIVCSGYGRKGRNDLSGLGQHIASMPIDDTGDELMEMAESLPEVFFSIASSKTEAAKIIERQYRPDIIIIDDGFQHRRLSRQLDILLIDAGHDLRKDALFPLGRLREGLSSIGRADLIILTKANYPIDSDDFIRWLQVDFPGKEIIEMEFNNESVISGHNEISIDSFIDKPGYFFAGIGRFDNLRNHLMNILPKLSGDRRFPDHCRYAPADLKAIKNDLEKFNPKYIITTYKDYTKVRNFDFGLPLYYLKPTLRIRGKDDIFYRKVESVLKSE